MYPISHLQGWIHGLPGYEAIQVIPVEVVTFTPPVPITGNWFAAFLARVMQLLGVKTSTVKQSRLAFTIQAAPELRDNLEKLAAGATAIPLLRFTIRVDPEKERDDEYVLANAVIESVQRVEVGDTGVAIRAAKATTITNVRVRGTKRSAN